MKFNVDELEQKIIQCKKQKIEDVNKEELNELSDINIDRKKKGNERILDFVNKISNPYMFKINGRIVKIEFTNNNVNPEDSMANIIANLYR